MMKLLLAVIATCALVVSPTCIKIKHQLRSNAPTINVVISNGNTQMTSQVARDGSHRFTTDNLSNMTLAPAGSQTIQLSYDEIFPITDAGVCTEVHPLSAGGCADGVCCKVSISMYTITDAIIMTARVNNRKADGNPQFWRCEQEIQAPGVTNTEPTGEEIAAEILGNESPGDLDGCCGDDCNDREVNCRGDNTHCYSPSTSESGTCKCNNGYEADGNTHCIDQCTAGTHTCNLNDDSGAGCNFDFGAGSYTCACSTGFSSEEDPQRCIDINECDPDNPTHDCHIDGDSDATCDNTPGSYTCTCNSGFSGSGTTTCTDDDECADEENNNCKNDGDSSATCDNSPPGDYTCSCSQAFYMPAGNNHHCLDKDECALGTDTCVTDENIATCDGTTPTGSYTCTCNSGYEGDGTTTGTGCTAMIECGEEIPALYCDHAQYCNSDIENPTCESKKLGGNVCNNNNDQCVHENCSDVDNKCKDPAGEACVNQHVCASDKCTDNICKGPAGVACPGNYACDSGYCRDNICL